MTKKTAIQELFSKLEIEHPNLFNTNTLEGRQFVNDYYPFLELEKQQVIDAFNDGYRSGHFEDHKLGSKYYQEYY